MLLERLASVSEAVQATPKRLRKIALLAECLREAGPDIETCVAFLCGELRQGKLGIGYQTLRAAKPAAAAQRATLTIAEVDAEFDALLGTRGKGSKERKAERLYALFARATESEQRFLLRLLSGELRQGALEAVLLEAVAEASGVDRRELRRALMFAGDLRQVATQAMTGGRAALSKFRLQLCQPLRPMLAQSASSFAEGLEQLGGASAEYKLDGARVQVHKAGGDVRIYSRQLNDVTASVPEVVEALQALPEPELVLDAEVIALDQHARPLPFQMTMRRFGRKLNVAEQRERLPLSLFAFDLLHAAGDDLVDAPYAERLARLDGLAASNSDPRWRTVPRIERASLEQVAAFTEQALGAGHEGIMLKALDSPYEAGRRGAAWLKVKPSHTLDLVVLAAEWGSGRRRGWLSNLHLGARDPEQGGFVMLGKTFKGLTDELLRYQTAELQKRELYRDEYTVYVKPELVVEVAFDGVQESPHYPAGLALRFARVKRYRDDKSADAADTIETVRRIYLTGHTR